MVELADSYYIKSNRESGFGRYDVILEPKNPAKHDAIILEFKVKNKRREQTLEETVAWLEENRDKVCTQFTVDDLMHLYRGGRLSKSAKSCFSKFYPKQPFTFKTYLQVFLQNLLNFLFLQKHFPH